MALFFIVRFLCPRSIVPACLVALIHIPGFYSIFYSRALLSEAVTTFLLCWSFFFFTWAMHGVSRAAPILGGAGFGLVVLSRPEYAPFVLILSAILWFRKRGAAGGKNALRPVGIFLLAASLVVLPWTARNFYVFKKPILVTVGGGVNIFLGTIESKSNWTGWGEFPDDAFVNAEEKKRIMTLYDAHIRNTMIGGIEVMETDAALFRLGLERIKKYPGKVLHLWFEKIPRLWYQDYVAKYRDQEASGLIFILYFIFALVAFFTSHGQERLSLMPFAAIFVYLTLFFLPMQIEPRYAVASIPIIRCLTAIGIAKVFRWA